MRGIVGGSGVTVSVDDGSAVENVATLAPAVIARILIFLASLYFFVATRHETRTAILNSASRAVCAGALRTSFDVETFVSRYLLSITVINVSEGGFIAIPALLIVYAIVRNIVPGADWLEPPRTR